MISDNFQKAQIALVCWRDGHEYGGQNTMLAIAHVMRNRFMAGWGGGDWLMLIQGYDISRQEQTGAEWFRELPDIRDPDFRDFLGKIDLILDGREPDKMTDGALYFADLSKPIRPWFKENIIGKPDEHPRVAVVGPVYFFK